MSAPIDKGNKDWPKLKSWLVEKIEADRRNLEMVGLPDQHANAARGRIAAYRELIDEVEPATVPIPKARPSYHSHDDSRGQ